MGESPERNGELPERASRLKPALAGLALSVSGLLVVAALSWDAGKRAGPGWAPFEWMFFFGPITILTGAVIFLRGNIWGSRAFTRRTVLVVGIVALVIGGFPWAYTPLFVGGSPGNEGAGMLGTLLFILIGLPGLLMTLLGLAIRGWEPDE